MFLPPPPPFSSLLVGQIPGQASSSSHAICLTPLVYSNSLLSLLAIRRKRWKERVGPAVIALTSQHSTPSLPSTITSKKGSNVTSTHYTPSPVLKTDIICSYADCASLVWVVLERVYNFFLNVMVLQT
ncbi:UNVERIFIED_CONTAM: hypothetical protein K2H54_071652 [Gekko kuhli]